MSLAVGFDLDMTLIGPRPGVAAAMREVAARTGFPIDADVIVSRLGPPLHEELACWVPARCRCRRGTRRCARSPGG